MKQLMLLFCLLLGSYTLNAQKGDTFGEKVKPSGAVEGQAFLKGIEGKDSMNVKLKATILEVCQKKGCWMNVDLGNGKTMMVRFKDYGFFVPKDANGRTAIMDGKAFREVITVDMLRHYAEDAGKSKEEIEKITADEERLSFEASGVLILK